MTRTLIRSFTATNKVKILAIRFSALGDVAMTIPVVVAFCNAHPEVQVTMLTTGLCKKVYDTVTADVQNLNVKAVNLKKDYKGISGLNHLFAELDKEKFDAVADLHDVLRTKWLRMRFHLKHIHVAKIDKGRDEKKQLTRGGEKQQLISGFERYRKVFAALGYDFPISYDANAIAQKLRTSLAGKTNSDETIQIGIAPFAQHRGKIYPKEKMLQVISLLLEKNSNLHINLFGGPDEATELDQWASTCPQRICNRAGKQTIADDIRLMACLKCMVSMDSSNMHLASLVGTPVVSIWGATHPFAGFMGFGQDSDNAIQLPLPCRPCSIYGNKPCRLGTWECMEGIAPETIVNRILKQL